MEIITKFNIGDTAFLIENLKVYKAEIIRIEVGVGEKTEIDYRIKKTIPVGIFDEDISELTVSGEELFLSKQEAKDKLEEIKEVKEKAKEFERLYEGTYHTLTSMRLNGIGDWYSPAIASINR